MATEKNLREELLNQNGGREQETPDLRSKVLATDQARVARMKKLVVIAWTLVAACPVAAVVAHLFPLRPEFERVSTPLLLIPFQGFLLIAVIFTVSLYVRSRTLTMHQIQASLALIEEHLKKMSQKD